MISELFSDFHGEATDHLVTIEELSNIPFTAKTDTYDVLFRIVHTLKGNSMFLDDAHTSLPFLIKLIHSFESYLEFMSQKNAASEIDNVAIQLFHDVVADFLDNQILDIPQSYMNSLAYIDLLIPAPLRAIAQDTNKNVISDIVWNIITLIDEKRETSLILDKFQSLCSHELIEKKLQIILTLVHQHLCNTVRENAVECNPCFMTKLDTALCHLNNILRSHFDKRDYIQYLKRCLNMISQCPGCPNK